MGEKTIRPTANGRKHSRFTTRVWVLLLAAILLPRGSAPSDREGIATKYSGDKGIKNDPDVIFVEDFEASLASIQSRWDNVKQPEIMSLSVDVPPGSIGKHSLLMTHVGGKGTGGHLYRRLLPGYDHLYARFYVKFDPNAYEIHHMGTHMGGYNPPKRWPEGKAGIRPAGNDRFTTSVETHGSAWRWDFYTYWMGMRSSSDKKFWGNDFINDSSLKVERGKWICVELMMKMNDPVTDSNGELALWVDGKPWMKDGQVISHLGKGFPKGKWDWNRFLPDPQGEPFEGFAWRAVKELDLNYVWVYLYITKAPPGHVSKVWIDDIVVAKRYIGPINPLR